MGCGGAYGSGSYGSFVFGKGASLFLENARAVALNMVRVEFSEPVRAADYTARADATNPRNYRLITPGDALPRLAQWVFAQSPDTMHVAFDGTLTPEAAYQICVSENVESSTGDPMDPTPGCSCLSFVATSPVRDISDIGENDNLKRNDIANPFTPNDHDDLLGTFQITSTGDYENHSGRDYLKKRILRRATTQLGEFFHLPDYGFAEPRKSRITPDLLRRIQSRAHAQVLREPDVRSARVEVSLGALPSIVLITIRAETQSGEETVNLSLDLAEGTASA